ncbi:unnamed protein product [Ilex paraguariensis]|uniref:non-specific serine/threonine protein kinase n=1 Tax=Ilex paraguariensis TaxID=185542 RepID=A0ABC8TFC9_9AQUA
MEKTCFRCAVAMLLLSVSMVCLAETVTNLTVDQSALLAFKTHITFNSEGAFADSWSTNSSVCNWVGVFCATGRVTALNLSDMGLSGTIAPHLGNLSFLTTLDLSSNSFHGYIPNELAHLNQLKEIRLEFNNFSGEVPSWIGILPELQHLVLYNNSFEGSLPEEIGTLNLTRLNMAENSFTGFIPLRIFNMSALRMLGLSFNQFSGRLPSTMGLWLPNLERLYLDNNKLSGIIPSSISNSSKLTILSLIVNSFSGTVPNSLGNLRLLEELFIGGNNLTREFSTPELSFFSYLANCRNLRLLEISLNQLNGILPKSIGNLSTSLEYLGAFGCKIKGDIPSEIGNLISLHTLSLDDNDLTGSIPTALRRLDHLQRLYLENNRLQGYIPTDLCQLKNLGDLYLNDNMLHGPIPNCLGDLKSLRGVYLHSNRLNSTIPLNLWSLTDLLGLNLSLNSISGYLPSDIANLRAITQIDLSWNQLSGDIPSTIGGAQTLISISLAHNNIQGPIPRSLGSLTSLQTLDLSNNNLSGAIPTSLEELRYLQHLNLSFNRLQGEIPAGGSFVNFTAQSFMQNDELCGAPRLQVLPCKTRTLQRSRAKIVSLLRYILPPMITLGILVPAIIYVLLRWRKQNMNRQDHADSLPFAWKRISYYELLQATHAFSDDNLLGTGGFGSVYKGMISGEVSIAVKVFNLQIEGAFKSFDVECEVMRNIRHRNLVGIISSCSNMDFKALVLDYMPNGSLEKWLYSHNYCLDILQRLNIMIDVASALEYLHHGHTTPVVHCDLKPSNVLLDEDMIAHVGDFGISKLFGEGEFTAQTTTLATVGYMAPEYGMEGIISTKGDVYSYGILLMETFIRKKPTDEMFAGELSLKKWVNKALAGSVMEVVDTNLIGREDEHYSVKEHCVSSLLHLAMDCSSDSPDERINMEDVLPRLRKIKVKFLETAM